MDLTCIILTWNSAACIAQCLQTLAKDLQSGSLQYEIIVVDNGSTDNTRSVIQQFSHLPITLIPLGRNTGTTFSRNIALRMARGRYVAILDSDIEIIETDTVSRLLAILESRQDIGIIAPALRYQSGRHQKSSDAFPTLGRKVKRYFRLRAMEQQEARSRCEESGTLQEVDYAISAFWLFRRGLIDAIGPLDENIVYAPEDVDWCLRTWLAGMSVVVDSRVTAVHAAQEISRKGLISRGTFNHVVGLIYFYYKHRYVLSTKNLLGRIAAARSSRDGSQRQVQR